VATKNEKLSALQRQIKELTEQQEELNESADHFLDIGEKALATTTDRLDLQREELDQEAKKAGLQREQIALAKQKIELQRNAQGELSAANEEALKVLEQKDKWFKQHAVVLKEQAKSLHYQKEIAQASLGAFDSIASKMMISQSSTAAAAKNMLVMWKNAVKVEGVVKATYKSLKAIGGSFLDIFNPINLITSGMKMIFTESYEYMMRTSQAMANFSKATGDAGEMTKDLGAAMNYASGVDIEAVASAGAALAGSWTGMADASGAVRSSVIGMTAELERMGQSGGDTGKSLNFMTRGMGMSMPAAEDAMKGLASSAMDLGQTPAQIGSNFRAMAGTLALYGGRILDKFTDIAAMAKATGLEMTDIATIGEGFDTFEGAASKVGALNALVGGPMLDSMEMLQLQSEEGPEAVTKAVIESLKAQGKSYETMGYQERKAMSETLGISGDKFAMMMGYQDEEMKKAAKKAKKEQKSQERYQKMLTATVSLAEQIKLALTAVFGNPKLQAAMKELLGVFIGGGMEGKEVFTEIGNQMAGIVDEVIIFAKFFKREIIPYIKDFVHWLKGDTKLFGLFKAANWQIALAGLLALKLGMGGLLLRGAGKLVGAAARGGGRLAMSGAGAIATKVQGKGGFVAKRLRAAKAEKLWEARKAGKKGFFSKMGGLFKGGGGKLLKGAGKLLFKALTGPLLSGLIALVMRIPQIFRDITGKGTFMEKLKKVGIQLGAVIVDAFTLGFGGDWFVDLFKEQVSNSPIEQGPMRPVGKKIGTAVRLGIEEVSPLGTAVDDIKNDSTSMISAASTNKSNIGAQIAREFAKEMKKNNEPTQMEIKLTLDDILGVSSPVHKILYDSINNTLKKQTA